MERWQVMWNRLDQAQVLSRHGVRVAFSAN
jgi:hypothetical protein